MKRFMLAIALALLLLLALPSQAAQPAPVRANLPIVATAPFVPAEQSTCDGSAPLLNRDTGDLDAVLTHDGHYLVAYQDRQAGGKLRVAAHIGAALTESAPWLPALAEIAPAFSPTPIKGGSVALVAGPTRTRLYFTQRDPHDGSPNEGPYGIWCREF